MATRRMVAREIIEGDAFLDLSRDAQVLYFFLNVNGDDDGFVSNATFVARSLGCKKGSLEELEKNSFVIQFEGGVLVIRHWRVHNSIQADRYHETRYKTERATLSLNDKQEYIPFDEKLGGVPPMCKSKKDKNNEENLNGYNENLNVSSENLNVSSSQSKSSQSKKGQEKSSQPISSQEEESQPENCNARLLDVLAYYKKYRSNNNVPPGEYNEIMSLCKTYGFSEVHDAIEKSALHNGKSLSYVRKTLENREA